jgi:hypothetical protein
MNKIKKKKIYNLINNYLIKINKRKKILIPTEYFNTYENNNIFLINFNENIKIPKIIKINKYIIIKKVFNNFFLINSEINYNIIYNFNKIMFIEKKKKNKRTYFNNK